MKEQHTVPDLQIISLHGQDTIAESAIITLNSLDYLEP